MNKQKTKQRMSESESESDRTKAEAYVVGVFLNVGNTFPNRLCKSINSFNLLFDSFHFFSISCYWGLCCLYFTFVDSHCMFP